MKNKSFAHQIKLEVLQKDMSPKEISEFLKGVIFSSSYFQDSNNVIIRISDAKVSSLVRNLFHKINIKTYWTTENKNWIVFIKDQLNFLDKKIPKISTYFFAGFFAASGSISPLDQKFYHLEFSCYYQDIIELIDSHLKKYFSGSIIKRKNKYFYYFKKVENISDFLKAIQAVNSFYSFEDTRILRDISNAANRQSSLDTFNQRKLVDTSFEHIENYKLIKKHKLEYLFSEKELNFYKLKKQNRFSSLKELAELYEKKYNIKITKSGLNHWMIKLKKVINNFLKINNY